MSKLSRLLVAANLIAIIAMAIWFRCRDLENLPDINGDEAWYGVQAESVLHGEPIDWRTPTGNLLNPLFFGPQLLVHSICKPSIAALRGTAVASGLLALAVNYWLCLGVFGRRIAVISTTILAVLPVNIVYSRLGWDASQSLLVTLPAIYWPLRAIVAPRKRMLLACGSLVALAVAIVVHPTNLFIAPVVAVALAVAWRSELGVIWRTPLGLAALFSVTTAALVLAGLHEQQRLEEIGNRVSNPSEYAEFAVNLERLFSGVTSYQFVAGSLFARSGEDWLSGPAPFDLAVPVIACLTAFGIYKRIAKDCEPLDDDSDDSESADPNSAGAVLALLFGWGLSVIALFVVAGPAAIAPHFERYGLFFIGPVAILAAIAVEWWCQREGWIGRSATVLYLTCGWAVLAGFNANFFDFIKQNGGQSHWTFRTAAVEPKKMALDVIRRHSKSPVEIRTSEWWLYWPLRYLSYNRDMNNSISIDVVSSSPKAAQSAGFSTVWQVEFTDSPACEVERRLLAGAGIPLNETTINDFAGRPIISMFEVTGIVRSNPDYKSRGSQRRAPPTRR
jgi:hypothetical protein